MPCLLLVWGESRCGEGEGRRYGCGRQGDGNEKSFFCNGRCDSELQWVRLGGHIVINGDYYQNYWDNPIDAGYLNNGDNVTANGADFEGNWQGYYYLPTLGGPGFLNSAGTLTANNCTFNGRWGIVNYDTVTANNCAFVTSCGIENSGTATVNDCTIQGAYEGIENFSTLTVNGGTLLGISYGVDNETGEVTINGGSVSADAVAVENSRFGTLIINGGAITGVLGPGLGAGVENYGTLIMNGGSISSNSNDPSVFIPSVDNGGTMTIYGGNLSSITDEAGGLTTIYGTFSQDGAITSSEGTITGTLADGTNATIV